MSRKTDMARLDRVLSFIADIEEIVGRHGSIDATLGDKEGQYALMLCLGQIGELLGKVESVDLIEKLPVRMAQALRNIIVHDYEGLEFAIIRKLLQDSLPSLKKAIIPLLPSE
jgi:uncharacterized protein with HEPN domain